MASMSYRQCIWCGGVAVYNPRDDCWGCRDCHFEWASGPWGVSMYHLGKDWGIFERSGWTVVPSNVILVLSEAPE